MLITGSYLVIILVLVKTFVLIQKVSILPLFSILANRNEFYTT